jgi:hypothetical protein
MRIQHTVSAFQAIFVRASESGQAARDKDKDKDLRDNIADVLDGGQLVILQATNVTIEELIDWTRWRSRVRLQAGGS